MFTSDTKAVLEAAAKRPTPAGADVTALDDQFLFRLDETGHIFRTRHLIMRIETEAGVKEFSQLSQPWLEWRQRKPELRVRVISPDGQPHLLDPNTITEASIPATLPGVFTDAKMLSAPLPALAKGAVIEVEFLVNDRQVVDPGGTHEQTIFLLPVVHLSVTIDAPAKSPLNIKSRGIADLKRTDSSEGLTQRVVLDASDVPAPEAITLAPPDAAIVRKIEFSTVSNWQQVAQWYASVVDEQAGIAALAPARDPTLSLAQIETILADIQKKVRYTGVELGLAAFVPRKPEETLARGYGDCKDKAVLLVRKLREGGIAAQVALLVPAPALDVEPSVPGVEAFSHAIVYVPGDHPLWIDPTSEFTPARRLPQGDQGRLALVIDRRTTGLVRTPESKLEDDRSLETFTIHLVESGKPSVTELREESGGAEDILRSVADQMLTITAEQKTAQYAAFKKVLPVEDVFLGGLGISA